MLKSIFGDEIFKILKENFQNFQGVKVRRKFDFLAPNRSENIPNTSLGFTNTLIQLMEMCLDTLDVAFECVELIMKLF